MNMKNLSKGTKVRTTEMVAVGRDNRAFVFIPAGTEVEITARYLQMQNDASYGVRGVTNAGGIGEGIAFHDEIEEV